jgi:chromate transporter
VASIRPPTKASPETAKTDPTAVFPSLGEAVRVWFRIGCLSFGGPAGQIALMHREVVEDRRWIGDRRFLHALNFCSLLPGPEAQQLATYLGWLMHGAVGGIIAGLLFIVPGALVMLGLSVLFVTAGEIPAVSAVFFGLSCAVVAIVLNALYKVAKRALSGVIAWTLAGLSFAALFFLSVPFPLVVIAAALVGFLLPKQFQGGHKEQAGQGTLAMLDHVISQNPDFMAMRAKSARRAGLLSLLAWVAPVLALVLVGGFYSDVALFFSKMAVVTFGGAYAVLTYVAQQAVENYGWLTPDEMLTGLGLAETTPGPLILVLEFVGFLAGYAAQGSLWSGVLAACITLWVTFAPCFVFVFLGAPAIERLQENPRLAGALSAITASVVGVIANLACWFGLRILFMDLATFQIGPISMDMPVLTSLDISAVWVTALALLAVFRYRLGVIATLSICAVFGLGLRLILG